MHDDLHIPRYAEIDPETVDSSWRWRIDLAVDVACLRLAMPKPAVVWCRRSAEVADRDVALQPGFAARGWVFFDEEVEKIYLNADTADLETVLHEVRHRWQRGRDEYPDHQTRETDAVKWAARQMTIPVYVKEPIQ